MRIKFTILIMLFYLVSVFQSNAQQKSTKSDKAVTTKTAEGKTDSLTAEEPVDADSLVIEEPADSLETEVTADSLLYFRPEYTYDSAGKRDPFQSLVPVEEDEEEQKIKELFDYEDATVLGIVISEDDSYTLVQDSNDLSYVLREGDRVLGGYVTNVTNDGIYLHIVKYGRSMTIILRLESSKYTIIEEGDGETSLRRPGINISYEKGLPSSKEVIIEEVTVPYSEIKTIEEEWFGTKGGIPDISEEKTPPSETENQGSFFLVEPQNNSWIRLPYILVWTKAAGTEFSFSLIIDDDSDFSSPIVLKQGIKTSSYLINDEMKLPLNRKLFWKVIAIEPSGKRLNCKQTDMSFKIIGQK